MVYRLLVQNEMGSHWLPCSYKTKTMGLNQMELWSYAQPAASYILFKCDPHEGRTEIARIEATKT